MCNSVTSNIAFGYKLSTNATYAMHPGQCSGGVTRVLGAWYTTTGVTLWVNGSSSPHVDTFNVASGANLLVRVWD